MWLSPSLWCFVSMCLAHKRNLNVELATMAGMLHDLHSYQAMNTENHTEFEAELAR